MRKRFINMIFGFLLSYSCLFNVFCQDSMDLDNPEDEESAKDLPKMNKRHHKMMFLMIKREMPGLAAKIEHEKNNNPTVFRAFVTRMGSHDLKMARMGKNVDSEAKKLMEELMNKELDSFRLGDKYKRTKDEQTREEMQKELQVLLNDIFEMKELFQQNMIKHMEARIVKVKDFIDKRRELKTNIIAERIKELTQDEQQESVMKW